MKPILVHNYHECHSRKKRAAGTRLNCGEKSKKMVKHKLIMQNRQQKYDSDCKQNSQKHTIWSKRKRRALKEMTKKDGYLEKIC